MEREAFINELLNRRRQQYLATLTPLGRSLLRAKMVVARLAYEEGGVRRTTDGKIKGMIVL